MNTYQAGPAEKTRLRFVFDDTVMSFGLAPEATFEDIARKWSELAPRHHGSPIAIDVTLFDAMPNPALRARA